MNYIALIGYKSFKEKTSGADYLEFEAESFEKAEDIIIERINTYYAPDKDKALIAVRLIEINKSKEIEPHGNV